MSKVLVVVPFVLQILPEIDKWYANDVMCRSEPSIVCRPC